MENIYCFELKIWFFEGIVCVIIIEVLDILKLYLYSVIYLLFIVKLLIICILESVK